MTGDGGAGRYAIYDRIASGGMASVHFGMLRGPSGFRKIVAVKRLHAQFAHDPEFVAMLLDEARLASRVVHPNVAATLDVIHEGDEVLLVLEYVAGESLSRLLAVARNAGAGVPPRVAVAIASGLLHGLHAAHEARDDRGDLLDLVHRDVSPQNVLVGVDGVPKVVDFGVAKATGRSQVTREGELKGKLPYMAPEQIKNGTVSRQSDVWAASVVLWEMLAGQRLFGGDSDGHVYSKVVTERIRPPSSIKSEVPAEVDAIVMRGLSRDPAQRFATAREMSLALEAALAPATAAQVGAWVESVGGDAFAKRAAALAEVQRRHAHAELAPTAPDVLATSAATPSARPAEGGTPTDLRAESGSSTPRTKRSRNALALGAVALVAAAAARAAMSAAPRQGEHDAAPNATGSSDLSARADAPPAPASETAVVATSAAAVSSDVPPATRPEPTSHVVRVGRARTPRAGSAAAPRGDKCHTIDAAGIWHVNPECL